MKKVILLFSIVIASFSSSFSQLGTDFWFAPPNVTEYHNPPNFPLFLLITAMAQPATVTISIPANVGFVPIVVNIPANKSTRVNLTAFKAQLETRPTNTVVNTGLRIQSTNPITAYYEVSNTNNNEIFALKGANALGNEFYIPMHKDPNFYNHRFNNVPNDFAIASFDIVATQNATTVSIYSPVPVDGHPANTQFSITLNAGQTYSCGTTALTPAQGAPMADYYQNPNFHPAGAVVISDKPVAVTVKDDSDHDVPAGGCYDLIGDQIVPVDICGTDYIAVKGGLAINGRESVIITATQNSTKIYLAGSPTASATLFAGETYQVVIDSLLNTSTNNSIHIKASKPVYATHITGFGCELGSAILPPLNCAGSRQLSFVRSTNESFFITLLVKTTAIGDFTITGPGTATINPASFMIVPGTAGVWSAAKIQYNVTQVPVDSTFRISNSSELFAMGLINGGAATGCRYGYFSEFVAKIIADAGPNQIVCANKTVALNGSITGGANSGIWTTSGTGSFLPDATTLNATYVPGTADTIAGTVTLTLTSTSPCFPVSDAMVVTFTDAPWVSAGTDQSVCRNNPVTTLNGAITNAGGGQWSGGLGTFTPNNNALNATYTPTAAELASGSLTLTLTSILNGTCNPVSDNVVLTFTDPPTVNAGIDQTVCANNASAILNGSVTISTGGIWSGGTGSFIPGNTALGATYTPSAAEITAGSVTLTLTTTGNGGCTPVTDQMTILITPAPTSNAGIDRTVCANNASLTLSGAVTIATGGVWSGGLGVFAPNSTTLNAVYTPSAIEILNGTVTLTLTTTGNGSCNSVSDQMVITIGASPTANAGIDRTVCANNSNVTLAGSVIGATGGTWSGGTGTYAPNANTLNAVYTPSAAERTAGTVTLTLTTTGNGLCNPATDQMTITITAAPTANAGIDRTVCANNASLTLNGSVTVATGGQWSGGTGVYNPSNTSLSAVYTPSAAEITAGSVNLTLTTTGNGTCNSVSDAMLITITSAPTANAGLDRTVCANNSSLTLAGSVTVATGGAWSGGLGTYAPNNTTLNAVYTPTAAEILAGTLTLTLTTTGNGLCNAVTDQMTITITAPPTANAGLDQTVCSNNSATTLNGSVVGATGGTWSGGTGTYAPNANTLNAVYTPSAAERTAGTVTLTLTTTGNGLCNAVTDQMTITITAAPTANAGIDRTVCANNPNLTLSGAVTIATGGSWSGGSGTYNPSNTNLSAVYTPSAAEITAGSANLTLTTTGNGSCNSVSDVMTITITAAPTANAGLDRTVCANNANVTLAGTIVGATGGTWSGGLGTYAPNANTLNAVYTPSAAERIAGTVTLTLTSTGNGLCNAVTDQMTITISAAPTANAGIDQTVCANNATVTLNGSVVGATGGTWSGGTGTYAPNNNVLNPVYTPSAAERTAGTVTLTLTTTGNGLCSAVTDQMVITITPAPTSNAGLDRTVCANNPGLTLNGSVTVATGGSWSGGTGNYNPSNTSLSAVYTPSAAEITTGSANLILTTTGNGSCNSVTDAMIITINPAPTVNAGLNRTVCANNADVTLAGSVVGATGGAWSGGLGTFTPNNTTLNAVYSPTAAEIISGTVTLTLTSTGNGLCNPVTDQMTITISTAPTANAGIDQSVCNNNANVTLNGTVIGATGGAWSGGTGTYSPNNTTLNAVYTPSAAEKTAGTVTLTLTTTGNGLCSPVTDQMTITITPPPTANAGIDRTVCANNVNLTLNGSVTVATGGTWSGGTGTYNPNNTNLAAVYTPSAAEISAGTANLTLTTTGNGNCNSVSDAMIITINAAPVVNAGIDRTVCANNSNVTLAGSVVGATGGAWTGGSGTYAPNATTLNAVYTPSAAERTAGTVTLTLTSTGNGLCNAVTDQMTITITTAPTVNAGIDQTVCANNSATTLNGTVAGATGGIWSGGTGTYNPNNTALNAVYTPSAAERTAGTVTLTLTTTGNGLCTAVTDQMIITISPAPVVSAGIDKTVCANNASVSINGSVTVASGGLWSGGSGAFNPGNTALSIIYTPSPVEIAAGSVNLTLTSTGNGSCNAVSDAVLVTITPAPVVNAGIDQVVCANNPSLSLNGSVTGATGGVWSGGLGTFNPNNTTLNATYTPSASEVAAGTCNLTLTSTGNGTCNPVTDAMNITITLGPTANAGTDITVGANNANASLNGSVIVASGGTWSGGTGTYSPNNNTLNAVYTPSAAEITAGGVDLTLTTTGNGSCTPVSDMVHITITGAPVVNAGANQNSCANNASVTLNGSVTGATGGIWSGGTGTYTPNNTTLTAVYAPSAAEIALGTITLTLSSTGNGPNNPVTDQMTITINPAPIINAGSDQTVCANNSTVSLLGTVSGATGGQWTGGLGLYNPNANSLNTVYSPTAAEIASGSVTLTLTSTGNGTCNPVTNAMTVFFSPSPTASAGTDLTVCGNNPSVSLNGTVTVATGGNWSGGLGTFSPNSSTLNASYTPTAGEIASGTVLLTLTTTGNGTCSAVSDNITIFINPAPAVNSGSNINSCVNNPTVTLGGSVIYALGGQWSGGTGSYNPSNTTLNAVYTPSAIEIAAGSVTLTLTSTGNGGCLAVQDQMTINIGPTPIVNAGTDQTICSNNANISLNGSVSGATGGQWSGGLGIFSPSNTSLNVVYTPTVGEIASGSLTLTLTSTGNGSCNPVSDAMLITFAPAPTASAGLDQIVCANNSNINLNGSVTIATGGLWTGGTGTYNPNSTTLNAVYLPSASEIAIGTVTLTLTTTGNGTCIPVSDPVTFVINKAPIVNAGPDLSSCANNSTVTLNGSVTYAGGGIWSGGTGTYNPNNTTYNATYTPSAAEIAAGSVSLTLTSTGNGSCIPVTDIVLINITPSPVVSAGMDLSSCGNNPNVTLNGSVSNASGGLWSGGLGIFNPNNSVLNATYTPTAAEVTAGSVTLTLSSTGNGNCSSVNDQMFITYTPSPQVSAGVDQTVCANSPDITLNGSVTVATGGVWSGGLGTFAPNNTTLNTVYTPSSSEISQGYVDLTLTSTGNGTCNASTDAIHIIITPAPTVQAGPDQITCVNDLTISLTGYIAGVTSTGIWSTSGTGTFVPNASTLNASYVASSADSISQTVTLTLTSTGNGNCLPVNDALTLSILPAGLVNAGNDQTVCGNNANALMSGTVGGGATSGIWSSSGTGVFVPSNSFLNAVYIPSMADTSIGSVTLTLTANSCNNAQDQMQLTITEAPFVNAGNDITVCVDNLNIPINGVIGGATITGIWTTSGTGTFTPSNTSLNAVYHASALDSSSSYITLVLTPTGIGTCAPVVDSLRINILPPGIVNAGFDQTYCSNNATILLNGNITGGASLGMWSTSGTGTFIPDNTTLNATYIPSNADTSTGSVTLALTATNSCNFAMDIMQVNFTPAPWISAGPDQTLCENNPNATLTGNVSVATGGLWSTTGTGSFAPGNASLNTNYIPSASDLATGNVTLILTSTGNSGCAAVTDTLHITYSPSPVINAGLNQAVCSSSGQTQLQGTVTGGSTTGIWTTSGTGTFSPHDSTLNPIYIFSSADTLSGSVTLTFTSTHNGNCNQVSDNMVITFGNTAFTSAGNDVTSCVNNLTIPLNGFVTGGSTTGIWNTSGTGTFTPDNTTLNATYTCSSTDSILGNVQIFLASTLNGGCNAGHDTMVISLEQIPTLSAGADQLLCIGGNAVTLNGSSANTSGISWTTSGTGTFAPDNTTINASYLPSVADSLGANVSITLTSTGQISCSSVSDVMTITFTAPPIVNAGNDQFVCATNMSFSLNGNISGGTTTGIWGTSGTGTFVPDNTTLTATYVFSSTDSILGNVQLNLTSTNNGGCAAASDTMSIGLETVPVVDAGPNQAICIGSGFVNLNGTATGTPGILWSTNGSGTFNPDNTTLNAIYFPSLADSLGGSVQITLTSTGLTACSNVSDVMIVSFSYPSSTNAGPDQIVCASNMNAILNGTITGGTATGIWTSSGTGTFTPSANALNATYIPSQIDSIIGSVILTLSSTNNNGCPVTSDSMTVSINPLAGIDAGPDQNLCASDTIIQLAGSITNVTSAIWTSSGTGSFVPNDTTLNAQYIFSPADVVAGSVNLVLSSSLSTGCQVVTDTTVITLFTPLQVDFNYGTSCVNQAVTFNDNSTIFSGFVTNFHWDFGGGFTADTTDTSFIFTSTGPHDVTFTLTSSLGCIFSLTKTIYVNPIPVSDFTYSTECYLDSIQFTDASTLIEGNIGSWSWNFSDGGSSLIQNPSHIFIIPDTFNVSLTIVSDSGCTSSNTLPVVIHPLPDADFSYLYSCNTHNVYFTSTSTSSGDTLNSWNWTFNGTQTSTNENPVVYFPETGTFPVTLLVGSSPNCIDSVSTSINVFGAQAEFSFVNACKGNAVNFTDITGQTGGTVIKWDWDFGDGSVQDIQNPSHIFTTQTDFTVSLTVQTDSGCVDSVTHIVSIYPSPVANFSYTATNLTVDESIHFTDESIGATNWNWNFGDGIGNTTLQNPSYMFGSAGNFTVILYVSNEFNCTDSVYQNISIKGKDEAYAPVLPSGFTPNGDKSNDVFYVRGGPFLELEFKVYNEWGRMIYESTDQASGWDGTYKGVDQPIGVYVYTVKATTISNKLYKFSGEVTLIR